MEIKQRLGVMLRQKYNLSARIRFSSLLGLPGMHFGAFVRDVENNPTFKKLLYPSEKKHKIISYKKFPGTALSPLFYEFKEAANIDRTSLNIETLMSGRKEIMRLMQGLGRERFERLFLYNEEELIPSEISARSGLTEKEVGRIHDVLNEMAVYSEFCQPETTVYSNRIAYFKIAVIEKGAADTLIVRYLSPKCAQGKYAIDYARLNLLKKQKVFSPEECAAIERLIPRLELINARRSTMYQIIEQILKKQKAYICSGDEKQLVPFTQKEAALSIGIDNSLISRAVYGKTVETPAGIEKPLSFFFPSRKDIGKYIIKDLVENESQPLKDSALQQLIENQYGIRIARRTIALCREESGISSYKKRKI